MNILNCKKPEWYTEPPKWDFRLINQPLEQSYNNIEAKLKNENRKPDNFYFLLRSLLITSFQTYKAIRKLIAKFEKDTSQYPTQAHMLGRSLIDTLFTIVALVEDPTENSKKYEKAGYRNEWEAYIREYERYKNDPKWVDWLKTKKEKVIDQHAQSLNLSEEEKNNPAGTIKHWPIPARLLSRKSAISLSSDKKKFLEEVYSWRYGELSEWSHMNWGGMAMSMFAAMPEHHWTPGKFESDAVYTGILFLLMMLSEIEAVCNYGEVQNLRYSWTILNNIADEAKEYYDLRYDKLLKEREKGEVLLK